MSLLMNIGITFFAQKMDKVVRKHCCTLGLEASKEEKVFLLTKHELVRLASW